MGSSLSSGVGLIEDKFDHILGYLNTRIMYYTCISMYSGPMNTMEWLFEYLDIKLNPLKSKTFVDR